jgi:LacI family transcriptional regulator
VAADCIQTLALLDHHSEPVAKRFNLGICCEARKLGLEVRWLGQWNLGEDFEQTALKLAVTLAGLRTRSALLCAHAGVAYSILRQLVGLATRVPEEVAVVVLDKDVQRTAEMATVPMSAVRPDFWQQGYVAARVLHGMLRGRDYPGRKLIRIRQNEFIGRESTGRATTRDPFVRKALHGLEEGDLGSLSVDGLVRYAGMSRRTLEQRFKKELGTTLHRAISKRRIDEATRLLRAGDLTVAEVGFKCGFSSLHYFSTAYKKETGQTPGRVRQEGR